MLRMENGQMMERNHLKTCAADALRQPANLVGV